MKALVLSPHIDDAELGMGGTLFDHRRSTLLGYRHEWDITVAIFCGSYTTDEVSTQLAEENIWALKALGIGEDRRRLYHYPVRHLPTVPQEVRNRMMELREELHPEMVFCPSTYDTHQDHQTVCQEAYRIFKYGTVLGYSLPWNDHPPADTRLYVALSDAAVTAKLNALRCYESQKHRPYMSETYQTVLLDERGARVGVAQAEAFEVIRQVWHDTTGASK